MRSGRLPLASVIALMLGALTSVSIAQTPASLATMYETSARSEVPSFAGWSAARGRQLFQSTHSGNWSCASCHTDNPLADGKHAKTGKPIAALAPAANPSRFTNVDKVEKWFRRNCNDVLGRACTAQDKGDVLAYLMSLNP